MTRLNQYSQAMSETLTRQEQALLDIQEQLNQLTQEIRVNQQVHKGQQTFEKELTGWLKQGEKLMKDSASLYPAEALQDLVADVAEMAEKVANNYEDLAQSSRFLSGEPEPDIVTPEPEIPDFPLLKPEKKETDPLSQEEIYVELVELSEEVFDKIKLMVNSRAKSPNVIAKHILTTLRPDRIALNQLIATAVSLVPRSLAGTQLQIT